MKLKPLKKNTKGLRLAAAYGLITNRLGFCGPQNKEHKILYAFLVGGKKENKAKKILEKFEGAYAYYDLIAKKNRIKDVFNYKVVEAYWIGNKLLDKISAKDIKEMVQKKFISPFLLSKKEAERRIRKIPPRAKPHHSFHVLILGPVAGRIDLNSVKLKDLCRISWGEVAKIEKDKITVRRQPLKFGKKLTLGKSVARVITRDKKIVPSLKRGDWLSIHWNSAVEKLNNEKLENIRKYTAQVLKIVNN
jgi:uncharacterized lipoprotein YehR (DUF1307 family)